MMFELDNSTEPFNPPGSEPPFAVVPQRNPEPISALRSTKPTPLFSVSSAAIDESSSNLSPEQIELAPIIDKTFPAPVQERVPLRSNTDELIGLPLPDPERPGPELNYLGEIKFRREILNEQTLAVLEPEAIPVYYALLGDKDPGNLAFAAQKAVPSIAAFNPGDRGKEFSDASQGAVVANLYALHGLEGLDKYSDKSYSEMIYDFADTIEFLAEEDLVPGVDPPETGLTDPSAFIQSLLEPPEKIEYYAIQGKGDISFIARGFAEVDFDLRIETMADGRRFVDLGTLGGGGVGVGGTFGYRVEGSGEDVDALFAEGAAEAGVFLARGERYEIPEDMHTNRFILSLLILKTTELPIPQGFSPIAWVEKILPVSVENPLAKPLGIDDTQVKVSDTLEATLGGELTLDTRTLKGEEVGEIERVLGENIEASLEGGLAVTVSSYVGTDIASIEGSISGSVSAEEAGDLDLGPLDDFSGDFSYTASVEQFFDKDLSSPDSLGTTFKLEVVDANGYYLFGAEPDLSTEAFRQLWDDFANNGQGLSSIINLINLLELPSVREKSYPNLVSDSRSFGGGQSTGGGITFETQSIS